ncbi:DUF721 domain-containing protein [Bifidobacterium sp. SMB2]|uniref:DUF721 domain-containing protein n=1 Tax=Bifidobacterium saimiriisciurei TaxID=2661627 RepID=A0ABX0CBT4_9BIFI|nr:MULTISPECIES: DUF721 domain-containing protein [Bifidobacterium]NEG95533.1 DUF721 domain-containing protein [Bifidobacterium sp. SMB2]NEH11691.1 DUF721 domain-containing protein [Bifidobacterium saimiriisciurei]
MRRPERGGDARGAGGAGKVPARHDVPAAELLHLDPRKLEERVFERYTNRASGIARRKERARAAWQNFGKPGRDPSTLSSVLSGLAARGNWRPHLMIAQLGRHWDQVVGPGIAQHSRVASYRDGVLTIQAESSVWATQLTYMIPQMQKTIAERLQGMPLDRIVVTGPRSGSFKHGANDRSTGQWRPRGRY